MGIEFYVPFLKMSDVLPTKFCFKLNDVEILARPGDLYVDGTLMCKAAGKKFAHYLQSSSTKEFIHALSQKLGALPETLMDITAGVNGRSWIHRQIAYHLAQWCSPTFAAQVSGWLDELLAFGNINLSERAPSESEKIAALEKKLQAMELEKRELQLMDRPFSDPREQLKFYKDATELFAVLGMKEDDRTKAVLQSALLNSIGGLSTEDLSPEISVSLRIHDKYRLVLPNDQLSVIGKRLAAKYRTLFPNDPKKKLSVVHGSNRRVNYYTEKDWENWGDSVLELELRNMNKLKRDTQTKLVLTKRK